MLTNVQKNVLHLNVEQKYVTVVESCAINRYGVTMVVMNLLVFIVNDFLPEKIVLHDMAWTYVFCNNYRDSPNKLVCEESIRFGTSCIEQQMSFEFTLKEEKMLGTGRMV